MQRLGHKELLEKYAKVDVTERERMERSPLIVQKSLLHPGGEHMHNKLKDKTAELKESISLEKESK